MTLFGKQAVGVGVAIAGWIAMVAIPGIAVASPPVSAATLAAQTVDQFQRNGGVFRGYRRNHAKGVCVTGHFQSSGKLAPFSVAEVFAAGQRTPVVGRLSIPGTNPYAWDGATPIRGMALDFLQADGQQWRTAMNAVPAFPVATPEANLEFLKAQQPERATGDPDPARLAAFFATHPSAAAFRDWDRTTPPPASFATVAYNSLDAFELVDAKGARRAVRWSMQPEATPDAAKPPANDPDYLATDLRRRLAHGVLKWRLVFTFAAPGDKVDDAAIAWPADRRHVDAGTLVVEASQPQSGGVCRDMNFNPLVLPRGIAPSNDPLLKARADAYADSWRRRVGEEQRAHAPPPTAPANH